MGSEESGSSQHAVKSAMPAGFDQKLSSQQGQIDSLIRQMQNVVEQTQRQVPPRVAGAMDPSGGFDGSEARLKEIEGLLDRQEAELSSLRSLTVEMQCGLLMQSVKASRVALRCVDLSKEERQKALQSLDAKE